MIRQLLLSEAEPGADVMRPTNPGAFTRLSAEFPTVALCFRAPEEPGRRVRLEAPEWRAPGFEPCFWDERIFAAAASAPPHEGLCLHLTGAPGQALAATAMEVLTRYQGLLGRRNAASEGAPFDTLLARHRALHEPLALADYRHALDTWQWVLRLAPRADLALQVAALFHGLEASRPDGVLSALGLEPGTRERVYGLLQSGRHAADADLALLHDARALSFFSLSAAGAARALPRAQAQRTVAQALARLRPQHRWRLTRIRLAPPVRRLLEEALGEVPLPAVGAEREERRGMYVASR